MQQKDWTAAIADYRRAYNLDPPGGLEEIYRWGLLNNLAIALNNQAMAAYFQGNYDAAIVGLQQALQANPHNKTAQGNILCAQAMKASYQGDYVTALADFQKAVQANHDRTFRKNVSSLQQRVTAQQAQAQQREQQQAGQQVTMRDFQQTLDGQTDLHRLDASSAAPNAGNQNPGAAAGGAAGSQLTSPGAATPPAAATGSAPVAAPANGQAPSAVAAPETFGNAQGLKATPPGERTETSAQAKPTQGGNPIAPLPAPGDVLAPDFDQRNASQAPGGDAAPGIKFQPSAATATALAAATQPQPSTVGETPTATSPPQPVGQPQPKPPSPQGGISFERPDSTTVNLRGSQGALALRPKDLKEPAPKPIPAAAGAVNPNPVVLPDESALQYLFAEDPKAESKWPGPKDPNFPLINPLREEAVYQKELKQLDDWALTTTLSRVTRGPDAVEDTLHGQAIQAYAPEFFDRYQRDPDFHASVNLMLRNADDLAIGDYYQGIADAQKAGIVYYRDTLKKLENAGVLEPGMGIRDEEQRHPELIPVVQAVAVAAGKEEDGQLAKARASSGTILDGYYRIEFGIIRNKFAAESK